MSYPQVIIDLSVFQNMMRETTPKNRAKYGDVTQYFLTHTEEERLACMCDALNLPISFFDFIFKHKSKSDFTTLVARYRFWSAHIPDENLLTPFFFNGILEHTPISIPLKNNLDFLTVTEPFKLFNLECVGEITIPEKRVQYTSSFARMLGIYILLKTLKVDLSCFKYWSFDGIIEENLNSIGHSSKSILKIIIQQMREHYGTHGFLDETLTIKYMANIVDARQLIPKLVSGFLTNSDYRENDLRRIVVNLASDFRTDGIYVRTGFDVVMALYIKRYARWTSRTDTTMMEDGTVFYTHRHSMINAFLQEQQNFEVGYKCVPESLDVKPSVFFKEYIEKYAKAEYAKIEEQYGTETFEDMSKIFTHLDSSKYRYLENPMDLILEGRNMSHCVGGSDYIEECMSSETFILHYSDESRFGYTIELTRRVVTFDEMGSLFKHSTTDHTCTGYTIYQIKGHNNSIPSPEVEREILIGLFTASAKLTGKVGAELDSLIHQHKVSFRNRHPALKDPTTIDYFPVADSYNCVPFKSINHQAKNKLEIDSLNNVMVMQYGRSRPTAIGWDAGDQVPLLGHDFEIDGPGELTATQVMHQQMQRWHPHRNPALVRGDIEFNVPPRQPMLDMDITLTYPSSHDFLIGPTTLKDVGLGDLFETLFSRTISSVRNPHIKKDGSVYQLKVFQRNTGREYLVGQSLFSLGEVIVSWRIIHGQVPLMVKLGMSILANKIRYGIMSEADIVKVIIRLANHGMGLFNPTVNWLASPIPMINKPSLYGSADNPKYKVSYTGERFNAGAAVVRGNMDFIHKTNLNRMVISKMNHLESEISPTLNFNFNEPFTRDLFGGYV